MIEEILKRKSYRNFSNKEVDERIILDIIEAGRLAPSCYNNQPWHYVLLKGKEKSIINDHINRGNSWAKNAYAYIVMVCNPNVDCNINGINYSLFDCGLSVENMLLEAFHNGLIAHSIAGFNSEGLKKALKIPENFLIPAIIILGYPNGNEERARERKGIDEILHMGGW
ncbi:MAG: nitroreductase family protein [Thermoplasmata archaeon]